MDRLYDLLIPLTLIGLISLIVGVILGILISSLRSSGEQERQRKTRNLKEIFRFLRDQRNSQIVLEINGKIYKRPDDLSMKTHTGLVQLCDEMRIWLGVPDFGDRIQSIDTQNMEAIDVPQSTAPVTAGDNRQSVNFVKDLQESSIQREKTTEVVNQAISTESQTVIETPRSIAAQIDEILQKKLSNSTLKDRVITLLELPGKGLVVVVDSEQYESVDEVPEIAVRELIRECVSEWEKKTSAV